MQTLTGADGTALTGTGVSVGVIDSGVDPTHPYLTEDGRHLGGRQQQEDGLRPVRGVLPGRRGAQHRRHRHAVGRRPRHPRRRHRRGPADRAVGRLDASTAPPRAPSWCRCRPAPGLVIIGADAALNWVLENHEAPCGEGVPAAECPPIKVTNNSYGPSGGGEFDPQSATVKLQRALAAEGVVDRVGRRQRRRRRLREPHQPARTGPDRRHPQRRVLQRPRDRHPRRRGQRVLLARPGRRPST